MTDAVTSQQAIVRSQDGTNWSRVPSPTVTAISALAVADTGELYVAAKSNPSGYYSASNFYRYVNGRWFGPINYSTFSPDEFAAPGAIIRAGNDLIGIEQTFGRISYSTDDGNNWATPVTNPMGYKPGQCNVAIVDGVMHELCGSPVSGSTTYGRWSLGTRSWFSVNVPPTVYGGAQLLVPRNRDELWIGYVRNGMLGLARSIDGGDIWQTIDTGSTVPNSMCATGCTLALGGDDRVYVFGLIGGHLARVDRSLGAVADWSSATVLDSQLTISPLYAYTPVPTAAAEPTPPDVWLSVYTAGTNPLTYEWHHYGSLGGPVPIFAGMTFGPSTVPSPFAYRPQLTMADPVNSATGSYTDQVTDAALPAIGVPLAMTRTYNSADPTVGLMGPAWTFTFATALTINTGGVMLRAGDGQQVPYTLNPDGSYSGPPGGLATLLHNADGSYTITTRQRDHYLFDAAGRLTGITDRNDHGVTVSNDANGRPQTVTGSGRSITFGYNGDGLLSTATLSDGRSVGYTYTNGLLTDVRDLRGGHTVYAYDNGGRLASIEDANGNFVMQTTYDPATGRVTDQTDARGKHTSFGWDPITQTATMTAPDGAVWQDIYSGNVLIRQVNPLGQATTFSYDTDLHLVAVTDPAGNTTQSTYNDAGDLIREQTPDGAIYTYAYDGLHDQTSSTSPNGTTVSYSYDARGNLTGTSRPNPAGGPAITTSVTLDPATGLVTDSTDARGKTTHIDYDSHGDPASQTSPLGETTTWTYDPAGRVTTVVSPRGNVAGADPAQYRTSYTYDDANNTLTVTDPLGHTATSTYDPVGNLTTSTDAKNRTTSYTYNKQNEITKITPPGPIGPTSYVYNANGQLSSTTEPGNVVTSYHYDKAGRLTSSTGLLGTTSFGYDAAGNRTSSTDPAGNTVTIGYDAMHRVTLLTYPDGTAPVTYTYDPDGNRLSMTDGAGTVYYTFDALDRPTTVTRGTDTFAYGYDNAGNLTSRTFPGQASDTFTYDNDARLATVTTGTTTAASYTYDPDSELTQTALANGITQTGTWDPNGQLTTITSTNSAHTVLAGTSYSYDATGNPTTVTDPAGDTTSYAFDSADRLTAACYHTTDCATATDYIRWTYDDLGHRLSETRPAGTTTYTYNAKDQLTQTSGPTGTTTYGYDTDGNQTQTGTTTATYNTAGRMTSQTTAGTTTSYNYDGDGRRLSATTDATTDQFLWDPTSYQLALERNNTGNLIRRYTYGNGLISMTTAGTSPDTYYYLPDRQGSTLALTDSTGALDWTYQWEPYGLPKTTTKVNPNAPDNPRQWLGEYTDSTQTHLRARQYDPATGQFTSPDQGGSGDTYGYANTNPLANTDPLGLWSWRGFTHFMHNVSGAASAVFGIAAIGCAAIIVCAPLAPVLGGIALTAGAVYAGTGAVIAGDECSSPKGSCAAALFDALVGAAGVVPMAGMLDGAGGFWPAFKRFMLGKPDAPLIENNATVRDLKDLIMGNPYDPKKDVFDDYSGDRLLEATRRPLDPKTGKPSAAEQLGINPEQTTIINGVHRVTQLIKFANAGKISWDEPIPIRGWIGQ